MRRPVTQTQKEDKRKAALSIIEDFIQSVKNEVDSRTQGNIKDFILGIIVKGTTRLKDICEFEVKIKKGCAKRHMDRLSYLLKEAKFDEEKLFQNAVCKALKDLKKSKKIKLFFERPLLIVDPTFYYKRSRGRKCGMEYISLVKPEEKKGRPKKGYTDVWAALAIKDKKAFPLARCLSLPKEKGFLSQNKIVEDVIEKSSKLLKDTLGKDPILVGDRGVASKRLCWRYKSEGKDFSFRMKEVNARYVGERKIEDKDKEKSVLEIAKELPPLGEITWKEKERKKKKLKDVEIKGNLFAFPAELTYYASKKAILNFVIVIPFDKKKEPLIVATTLPIDTLYNVVQIVKIYEARWSIEVMFEYLKRGFGLDDFMVRAKTSISRILFLCSLAFISLTILLYKAKYSIVRFAQRILYKFSVCPKKLTIGKLREALSLDFQNYPKKWKALL